MLLRVPDHHRDPLANPHATPIGVLSRPLPSFRLQPRQQLDHLQPQPLEIAENGGKIGILVLAVTHHRLLVVRGQHGVCFRDHHAQTTPPHLRVVAQVPADLL